MNKESIDKKWFKNPSTIIPLIGGTYFAILLALVFNNPACNTNNLDSYTIFLCSIKEYRVGILLYVLLVFILIGYFLIGRHTIIKEVIKHNSRARIAILLPISCTGEYENEDLALIAEGFGDGLRDFIKKKSSELSEAYEIVLIDNHEYRYALDKIKNELQNGTKYIISTTSKFSTKFVKDFLSISPKDAILITTISGSTLIEDISNRVYNFYPTAVKEIDAIINFTTSQNLFNPFIYSYNSTYPQELKSTFVKCWNEINAKPHHINGDDYSFDFMNINDIDINNINFYNEKVEKSDCILIFGYGKSFFDIIKELKIHCDDLKNKIIITISTFNYYKENNEHLSLLEGLKLITTRPKMKNNLRFSTNKDVVRYFSEQTLDRLLNTLERKNKKRKMTFDKAWELSYHKKLDLVDKRHIQIETLEI